MNEEGMSKPVINFIERDYHKIIIKVLNMLMECLLTTGQPNEESYPAETSTNSGSNWERMKTESIDKNC